MVNQTIIPEKFSDCTTKLQFANLEKNNILNPIEYFELALTKVYDLSEQQKIDLQNYIDDPKHTMILIWKSWDIYCSIHSRTSQNRILSKRIT